MVLYIFMYIEKNCFFKQDIKMRHANILTLFFVERKISISKLIACGVYRNSRGRLAIEV